MKLRIIVVFLLMSTLSYAQVGLSIIAGGNISKPIFSKVNFSYAGGIQFGFELDKSISEKSNLVGSVLFTNYSFIENVEIFIGNSSPLLNYKLNYRFNYLQIPIGLRHNFSDKFGIISCIAYSRKITAKITQDGNDYAADFTKKGIKGSIFSVKLGTLVSLSKRVKIQFLYDFGLTDVTDVTDNSIWPINGASRENLQSYQLSTQVNLNAR